MPPLKSYRIWFSQRNGSTLLCKALEQTGIAGKPGELFNIGNDESMLEHYQVNDYEQLKTKLWELGTSTNGVFGAKNSMLTYRMQKILNEILNLKNLESEDRMYDEAVWSDLFPNCKHIFLTRRNKVRQAVSWWKAIKDQKWHLEANTNYEEDSLFYEENYDFDALFHLFKETALRECAIQEYFSKNNIVPLTIVYEDFIQDYESTIFKMLDFLQLDTDGVKIAEKFYQKTANTNSEKWIQRFRKDLQENWENQIW